MNFVPWYLMAIENLHFFPPDSSGFQSTSEHFYLKARCISVLNSANNSFRCT